MLASEDICAVVEMVMKEMTEMPVEPCAAHPRPLDLTGYEVEISGAFNGRVVFEASSETALEIASRMLSIETAETTEGDLQEVMAELTNMIGGNVKSLLPGPSVMSIPKCLTTDIAAIEQLSSDSQSTVVLCGGQPLWITLNNS